MKEEATALAAATTTDASFRARFIALRTELFKQGFYDPVLVRFDSHTMPRASSEEVAEQLGRVAAGL